MQDFISMGTGDSRFLKTSLEEGTTWEEALALLQAGIFPVDFNGFNAPGVAQYGTDLNKANLLSDETSKMFGNAETVNAALAKARLMIAAAQKSAEERAIIETGSYVGTGKWGETEPTTINLSAKPSLVIVQHDTVAIINASDGYIRARSLYSTTTHGVDTAGLGAAIDDATNVLSFYADYTNSGAFTAKMQCNTQNIKYNYIAIY